MGLLDLIVNLILPTERKNKPCVDSAGEEIQQPIMKRPVDIAPERIRISIPESLNPPMSKPMPVSISSLGTLEEKSAPQEREGKNAAAIEECNNRLDSKLTDIVENTSEKNSQDSEMSNIPVLNLVDQLQELNAPSDIDNSLSIEGAEDVDPVAFASFSNLLSFCFMTEKKPDNGEDSDPLLYINDRFAVVGVFDGMGGAGATMHVLGGIEKTGAYFASRKVEQATEAFIYHQAVESKDDLIHSDTIPDDLKSVIKSALRSLKEECPPKVKSGLKSAMIKEFPTTLSVAILNRSSNDNKVISLWAGDSRNYILTSKGLFQISIDDLEAKGDPFENLSSDSPLSNQVCADREFKINKLIVNIKEDQFVIFSATDGCFGYYPTPFHFEDALLRNLSKATNEHDWMQFLKEEFQNIAADDTSMSCIIYGYEDFFNLKNSLLERTRYIGSKIEDYNEVKQRIDEAKALVTKFEESFKCYKQNAWEEYRVDYMSYIS